MGQRSTSFRPPPSRGVAASVNPHAGNHAITTDPLELAAIGKAADLTWSHFPYYAARFPERGYSFAVSDGGWVVTLCDLPARDGNASIKWLASVLSSRGMPQLLLEDFLRVLHRELMELSTGGGHRYTFLRRAADRLRDQAEQILPQRTRETLADEFARATAGEAGSVAGFGEILVAACVDEAAGIENAVKSVESWATDARRFSANWIDQVRKTIADTRSAIAARR